MTTVRTYMPTLDGLELGTSPDERQLHPTRPSSDRPQSSATPQPARAKHHPRFA